MEKRAYEIFSHVNREISVKIIPGHFSTTYSDVSDIIDISIVNS